APPPRAAEMDPRRVDDVRAQPAHARLRADARRTRAASSRAQPLGAALRGHRQRARALGRDSVMKLPLWRRGQDRDLEEEIASPLRMEIADRGARGEPLDAATRAARRHFGNVAVVKEVTRDMWGWVVVEQFAQDVRYGLRALRKSPGFAVVAIA